MTLDMQSFPMINMTSVTELLKIEFSKQFEGYFVSVLLMHVYVAKTKNGKIISINGLYL